MNGSPVTKTARNPGANGPSSAATTAAATREPGRGGGGGGRGRIAAVGRPARRRRDLVFAVVALASFATVGPLSALFLYASTTLGTDPLARIDGEYGALGALLPTANATEGEREESEAYPEEPEEPVPVYILPQTYNPDKAGELKHFLWDGVDRSKRLRRARGPDEDGAVWIFDVVRLKCQALIPEVKASICRRLHANNSSAVAARRRDADSIAPEYADGNCSAAKFAEGKPDDVDLPFYRSRRPHVAPAWRVVIMDYTDSGYAYSIACAEKLSALLGGPEYVHLATRTTVRGRLVKHAGRAAHQPFHKLGAPVNWTTYRGAKHLGGVPRALRYGVRSDQVDFYEEYLNGTFLYDHGALDPAERANVLDLPSLTRKGDVVFFWNYGSDTEHGSHRDAVARTIQDMRAKQNTTLRVHVGTVGMRARSGRNQVQAQYAIELLKYKIIVVCQRDKWEGHYRTMEGFLGGAMVMTDPMHPLPVYIEDGKSVVVYNSLADLEEKILYYLSHASERLEIARRGHEIAMNHHRSWHGVERLVFGNWTHTHGIR